MTFSKKYIFKAYASFAEIHPLHLFSPRRFVKWGHSSGALCCFLFSSTAESSSAGLDVQMKDVLRDLEATSGLFRLCSVWRETRLSSSHTVLCLIVPLLAKLLNISQISSFTGRTWVRWWCFIACNGSGSRALLKKKLVFISFRGCRQVWEQWWHLCEESYLDHTDHPCESLWSIHPSSLPSFPFWDRGHRYPSSAVTVLEAGYTLPGQVANPLQGHRKTRQATIHSHSH